MKQKQMNFLKLLVGLMVFWAPLSAMADDVVFEGRTASSVAVGARFQLSYTVNADGEDIRLPDTSPFEVLMGPSVSTSQRHSIINGEISSSRSTTFTYVLKATQAGTFTLQPATVVVDGKRVQSNTLTITVSADDGNAGGNAQYGGNAAQQGVSRQQASQPEGSTPDIFVTQTLSKQSVYEGEGVVLTTKIYTRADLNSISDIVPPALNEFLVQDMMGDKQLEFRREVVDGVVYQSAESSRQVLIPHKSGKITIEPMEYEFIVKKRTRPMGGGGFFDTFFDNVQLVRQRVKSKPVTLTVKALPEPRPDGFSGGVGKFKFDVSVTPTDVEANNSVQVKVSVSGEGNLKVLSLPKPRFHSDFDTFDPRETANISPTSAGFNGTKSAEYLIIPRRDGQFEIPALKFTYFDLAQRQYVTLTKGPFTLNVSKADGTSSSAGGTVAFAGAGREQVQYVGKDIRYLHLDDTSLTPRNTFFLWSPLFFWLTGGPLLVLVGFFFVNRKKIKDNANIDMVKMRKANKTARKRLKVAAKLIKENKREAFFDEVMRALWGYLSDKLVLPLSELTKDNAKEEMQRQNIDEAVANDFMALLDTCEFARYAPAELSKSMDEVYREAADVIGRLDSNKKR